MTPWNDKLSLQSLNSRAATIGRNPAGSLLADSTKNVRAALVQRSPQSTSTTSVPSSTCTPGSSSQYCQYDVSSTADTTLPVALGVALPLFFAFVLCFWLHRRYRARQQREDANDKHKSLDFGLGELPFERSEKSSKKHLKFLPQMQLSAPDVDRPMRSRGISFDMMNPYVLPPLLHEDTRGSLHSLSRVQDYESPYHSVHLVKTPELGSGPPTYQSRPSSRKDSSSVNTASTDSSTKKSNLLAHAQKPATANVYIDSVSNSSSADTTPESSPIQKPEPAVLVARRVLEQPIIALSAAPAPSPRFVREGTDQKGAFVPPPRNDSRPLPPIITVPQQAERRPSPTLRSPTALAQHPPASTPTPRQAESRSPRTPASPRTDENDNTYADILGIVQKESRALPNIPETTGLGVQGVPYDRAEYRANKVGSFYREYFDDSGYGEEYLDGAAVFDPETGRFVVGGAPWASPVTRRAMTPPPRAPPRFRSSSSSRQSPNMQRSRAYSASAHGAMSPRGRHFARPVPMPGPLSTLPTPHLLKNDSEVMSAIQFAPPLSYKDRAAGKTPSPLLSEQPYVAPRNRAFTPLVSTFHDLPVMPSPHGLRKSASFTALDFAAPPRFRRGDGASGSSDGGSVRSGRSNMSAAHVAAMRSGAYRVSRIPKEFVGTRDDFAVSLRPAWDMRP